MFLATRNSMRAACPTDRQGTDKVGGVKGARRVVQAHRAKYFEGLRARAWAHRASAGGDSVLWASAMIVLASWGCDQKGKSWLGACGSKGHFKELSLSLSLSLSCRKRDQSNGPSCGRPLGAATSPARSCSQAHTRCERVARESAGAAQNAITRANPRGRGGRGETLAQGARPGRGARWRGSPVQQQQVAVELARHALLVRLQVLEGVEE